MESIVCNGLLKVRVAGQYGPLRWLCNALQTAAVVLLLVDTYILVKSRGWYFRVENVWLVRWKRNILLPLVLDKILILILNIILTLSPDQAFGMKSLGQQDILGIEPKIDWVVLKSILDPEGDIC